MVHTASLNNCMFRPSYRSSSGYILSYFKANHTVYTVSVFTDEISFTCERDNITWRWQIWRPKHVVVETSYVKHLLATYILKLCSTTFCWYLWSDQHNGDATPQNPLTTFRVEVKVPLSLCMSQRHVRDSKYSSPIINSGVRYRCAVSFGLGRLIHGIH